MRELAARVAMNRTAGDLEAGRVVEGLGRERFASTGSNLASSCAAPTTFISYYTDSLTLDLA